MLPVRQRQNDSLSVRVVIMPNMQTNVDVEATTTFTRRRGHKKWAPSHQRSLIHVTQNINVKQDGGAWNAGARQHMHDICEQPMCNSGHACVNIPNTGCTGAVMPRGDHDNMLTRLRANDTQPTS